MITHIFMIWILILFKDVLKTVYFPLQEYLKGYLLSIALKWFFLFAYVNNIKHFPFTSIEVKKFPINVGIQRRNVLSEPTFRIRRLKPRSQKL